MGFVGAGGIGQDLIEADPQVLLHRCQRHPVADHRHRHADRPRHRARCATRLLGLEARAAMQRPARVCRTGPASRERYPEHVPHRLAAPAIIAVRRCWRWRSRFRRSGLVQLEILVRAADPPASVSSADFVRLMLPPDPGSWAQSPIYLHALGETLSIAFLGTLGGGGAGVSGRAAGGRATSSPTGSSAFPVAALPRHHPRRRHADLGADLDQCRRAWARSPACWRSRLRDFGAFGKLFSEAIEAADKQPVEGVPSVRRQPRCTASASACCRRCCRCSPSQVLYYLRIEHALGDHHRHRRRRRHRPAAGRADPRAGMAEGLVPDPADPGHGGGDRLDLRASCASRSSARPAQRLTSQR